MNIIFVADEDQEYGAANSLFELVTCLTRIYNIKIIVFTCKYGDLNQKFNDSKIENYVIGHAPFLTGEGSTKLKRFIKKYFKRFLFLRYKYKNSLARRKVKHLIAFSNIDLIYTNVNRIDFGAFLSKKYKIPHIWHIREFGDNDYQLFSFRKNYIDFMNYNADRFIAISKAVNKAWIEKGIEKSKIKMVYNGIDMCSIRVKQEKINNGKINIVFTGSISDTKQQIQVIEALSILPNYLLKAIHIDFYGSGSKEYLSYLVNIINQKKLQEYVTFKGYMSNVSSCLSKYDVGIICSRSEGFGRATVEYMASGLCVIASNTGANSEIVIDNQTGLLYKFNEVEELALKLTFVVRNQKECREIGRKAQHYALNHFTKEINAEQIYSVIKDVIKNKN